MRIVTRALRITGRVQGVSYRAWTRGTAQKLGLTGWVRNSDDGAVLALLHGPDNKVEQMISACWTGPGAAKVRDVAISEAPSDTPAPTTFEILR